MCVETMKLEYLKTGSPDCPLIRLYDFSVGQASKLAAALSELVMGTRDEVAVHELEGVEVIANCQLTLRVGRWDQAVLQTGPPATFTCTLTAGRWEDVLGLMEPFCQGAGGHQWLIGSPGEAALVLSADGEW